MNLEREFSIKELISSKLIAIKIEEAVKKLKHIENEKEFYTNLKLRILLPI